MNVLVVANEKSRTGGEQIGRAKRELGPMLGYSRIISELDLPYAKGKQADRIREAASDSADLTVFLPGWWISRRARALWEYCRFADNPRALARTNRSGEWTILLRAAYFRPEAEGRRP